MRKMLWSHWWEMLAGVGVGFALALVIFAFMPVVRAGSPCTVPRAWGPLRSITNFGLPMTGEQLRLAFEDEAGTIRVLTDSCKPAFEVTRTP